jgi:hypothetical protein
VVPLELQAGPPGCRNWLNQIEWAELATQAPPPQTPALARQADFWSRCTLAEATQSSQWTVAELVERCVGQEYLYRLQVAVQELHKCGAVHHQTVPVHEGFRGETVWED